MIKPKVFVTRIIPDAGMDMVLDYCDATIWEEELPPPRSELIKNVQGTDGLLCLLTDQIDGELMEAAGSDLKVISNHAVGFDNVDIAEATRRGIPVGNTPGVLTDTTADFAFALLMAAARRVVEADRYTRAGRWKTWGPKVLLGQDVSGATLGIIGFGRIGKGMAKRAAGFDMRVLFYDPFYSGDPYAEKIGAESTDLETILSQADFVSVHTPLLDETYHLINDEAFGRMKRTAILINTSRGPVVDSDALYRALAGGSIAAAALDVTDPEPIPMDSPLLTLENLIIAPHIASGSVATRNKMATMAAANLIAGLRGERLPYCVNPEVYERP
jgi:glyoxylate reductase